MKTQKRHARTTTIKNGIIFNKLNFSERKSTITYLDNWLLSQVKQTQIKTNEKYDTLISYDQRVRSGTRIYYKCIFKLTKLI